MKNKIPVLMLVVLAALAIYSSVPSLDAQSSGDFIQANPPANTPLFNGTPGWPGSMGVNKYGDGWVILDSSHQTAIPYVPQPSQQTPLAASAGSGTTPIPSAYSTPSIVNTGKIIQCRFANGTNQSVTVSYDGTTASLTNIPAGAVEWDDLGADGAKVSTSVFVKAAPTPSSGTFEITCKAVS